GAGGVAQVVRASHLREPAVLTDAVDVHVDGALRLELRLRGNDVPQRGDGRGLVGRETRREQVRNGDRGDDRDDRDHDHELDQRKALRILHPFRLLRQLPFAPKVLSRGRPAGGASDSPIPSLLWHLTLFARGAGRSYRRPPGAT